jgi:hypothetical protein
MEEQMRTARPVLMMILLSAMTGCYAARIESGLPPSTTQIRQNFASSWIYGLVPPSTVKAAAECPDGVAIVETRLSFLNQLVGGLTLGIYTPMTIVVTCAEKSSASLFRPGTEMALSMSATDEEVQAVFSRAADEAVRTRQPVAVYTTP